MRGRVDDGRGVGRREMAWRRNEKGGGGEENTPCEGERVGEERKNKEVNCALR